MTLTTMILSQIKRLLKKNWNLNVLSKESQTFDPNQIPKYRKDRFEYILSRLRYSFANQHNELYNGYLVVMKKEFGIIYKRIHEQELLYFNEKQ